MKRILVLGFGAMVVWGCNTVAYDPGRFAPISGASSSLVGERASAVANDLGVTVKSLHVEVNITSGQNDEERERRLQGYSAWLKIAECQKGNLVVKSDRFAVPNQVYTRFGCSIEGVPSF